MVGVGFVEGRSVVSFFGDRVCGGLGFTSLCEGGGGGFIHLSVFGIGPVYGFGVLVFIVGVRVCALTADPATPATIPVHIDSREVLP